MSSFGDPFCLLNRNCSSSGVCGGFCRASATTRATSAVARSPQPSNGGPAVHEGLHRRRIRGADHLWRTERTWRQPKNRAAVVHMQGDALHRQCDGSEFRIPSSRHQTSPRNMIAGWGVVPQSKDGLLDHCPSSAISPPGTRQSHVAMLTKPQSSGKAV